MVWGEWRKRGKDKTNGGWWGGKGGIAKLTCNIKACGVCTKYETFPFGADCKQSCPSVATGLYINTIAFDSFPSYRTCACVSFTCICCFDRGIFSRSVAFCQPVQAGSSHDEDGNHSITRTHKQNAKIKKIKKENSKRDNEINCD